MYSTRNFIEKAAREIPEKALGYTTGYPDLDKVIRGLRPGEITIVGGWPTMGKTSLLANIAARSGVQVPQLIFSSEMSVSSIMARMLIDLAQIPGDIMRSGNLSEQEIQRKQIAITKLQNRPIFIDGSSHLTPAIVDAVCQEMSENVAGEYVVYIDYLQLMQANESTGSRRTDIDSIMTDLSVIAKTRQIPMVIACQLRRPDEKNYGRAPRLSDLKESSGIEQVADVVILIHRPAYFKMTEVDVTASDDGEAYLLIAKNRNGRQGKVPMLWIDSLTSFQDMGVLEESTDNLYSTPDQPVEAGDDGLGRTMDNLPDTSQDGSEIPEQIPGDTSDFVDDLLPPVVEDDIPF